ncbi:MAG: membrane protein [Ramlibacter sp.]
MVALLVVFLIAQLRAPTYVPWLYWLVVVLISIVGTQLTDALTDGLGVSLYWSTAAFGACLGVTFAAWHAREKTLSIKHVDSLPRELFYWTAILFTFALGTAAGDLATEALGLGFRWGTMAFGLAIGLTTVVWKLGGIEVLAFWIAYILTRPFGAALGDLLSQSREYGGIGLGPLVTSVIFLVVIVTLVAWEQMRSVRSNPTST